MLWRKAGETLCKTCTSVTSVLCSSRAGLTLTNRTWESCLTSDTKESCLTEWKWNSMHHMFLCHYSRQLRRWWFLHPFEIVSNQHIHLLPSGHQLWPRASEKNNPQIFEFQEPKKSQYPADCSSFICTYTAKPLSSTKQSTQGFVGVTSGWWTHKVEHFSIQNSHPVPLPFSRWFHWGKHGLAKQATCLCLILIGFGKS